MTVMMLLVDSGKAVAQQNPNCCTYTVSILTTIPNSCLPIRLVTRWNCNPGGTIFKTYTAPGIYVEPIGPPLLPPCPPACKLVSISIDNVNFIGPGQTKQIVIGNCCYIVSFGFDSTGCIVIKISRC
jgi:hypothetical protein